MAKEIKKEKIEIEIPSDMVKEGKPITIIKTNDRNEEYVLSNYQLNNEELDLSQQQEFAEYNFNSNKHLIDKIIEEDKESYITSNEKITRLAKDIHRNVESVKDANAIIEYYINSNDLIGRALEIIQNNINTKYTLTFPTSEKKKDIKDIKRTEKYDNLEVILEAISARTKEYYLCQKNMQLESLLIKIKTLQLTLKKLILLNYHY